MFPQYIPYLQKLLVIGKVFPRPYFCCVAENVADKNTKDKITDNSCGAIIFIKPVSQIYLRHPGSHLTTEEPA